MSPLVWTPRPPPLLGSEAAVPYKSGPIRVLTIPVPGSTEWLALGPSGVIPSPSREGYQSEATARAAVEGAVGRFLAPKKRGRKPGRTVRFARYLPAPLVEAARAEALRRDPTGEVVTDGHVIAEWAERGRGVE